MFPLMHGSRPSPKPKFGTLYNCDETTYVGLYGLPPHLHCFDKFLKNVILNFTFEDRQYNATVVPISIFLCSAERYTLKCTQNVFCAIFSDTMSAVTHGGSEIIKSIGHGLRDRFGNWDKQVILSLGNATSAVIHSTGGVTKDSTIGVANIIHSFSGMGTILYFV